MIRQRAYTTPVLLAPDDAMLTTPTVPVQFLNGLGVAAAYNRRLSDISPFLKYFPKASYNDPFYYKGRKLSTLQAVQLADKIVRNTISDTKRFANEVIADNSVYQVCKNLYDWLYRYVQYKKDEDGVEQLRRPARTIAESKQGVDCDCFSIFISSCLTNLGIPHYFRVIAIEGKGHLQHIYVVVPTKNVLGAPNTGNGFITIDPVLDTFDAEADNITAYYDYFMDVPAYSMNGLGNASDNLTDIFNALVVQRNSIIANPLKYQAAGYNPRAMVQMFDLAIDNFWTPNRDAILDMLARNDHQTLLNPATSDLSGLSGNLFQNIKKGVSQAAQQVKEVIKNPGGAAQNVINQVKDKLNIPQNVLDFIQNVIDTGKEVALFIPRKAFMALVALNFRALGTNLQKALQIPEQRNRLQQMWEGGFGGDFQNLINVINNGAKNKMLFGLGALGTAGTETVIATAAEAAPVLTSTQLATILSAVGGSAATVSKITDIVDKATEAKEKVQNAISQGQDAAARVQNAINQGKATVANAQTFINNNVPAFISNNLPKTTPSAQTNIVPPQNTLTPNPNAMIIGGSNVSLNPVQNQLPPTTANSFVSNPQETYTNTTQQNNPVTTSNGATTPPTAKKSNALPIALTLLLGLGIYKISQNGGGNKPSMSGVPSKKANKKTIKIKLS